MVEDAQQPRIGDVILPFLTGPLNIPQPLQQRLRTQALALLAAAAPVEPTWNRVLRMSLRD
ncbi:hypothetical protein [Myxococcus xanthus]|uniref:hypothetical protein n=1 Tax=Myxococcus xanthus TaxID=34 RepID=UPI001127524A|nr:hypothetical protein [Myxococcus xanthus]QDF04304.1 hypothetical protein BHS04_13965 [Myxococcus xanthus]